MYRVESCAPWLGARCDSYLSFPVATMYSVHWCHCHELRSSICGSFPASSRGVEPSQLSSFIIYPFHLGFPHRATATDLVAATLTTVRTSRVSISRHPAHGYQDLVLLVLTWAPTHGGSGSGDSTTPSGTAMHISEKQNTNSATPPKMASSNDNAYLNRYRMHQNSEFQTQPALLYRWVGLLITSPLLLALPTTLWPSPVSTPNLGVWVASWMHLDRGENGRGTEVDHIVNKGRWSHELGRDFGFQFWGLLCLLYQWQVSAMTALFTTSQLFQLTAMASIPCPSVS